MAEPVRVRRLTDQEGRRLQQIVRRGSTSSVRFRRAMMLLASAGGNRVPVIAQLVQADEDTVRDVIHRFNEIGLACLDPRWAGGRAGRGHTGAGPLRSVVAVAAGLVSSAVHRRVRRRAGRGGGPVESRDRGPARR